MTALDDNALNDILLAVWGRALDARAILHEEGGTEADYERKQAHAFRDARRQIRALAEGQL